MVIFLPLPNDYSKQLEIKFYTPKNKTLQQYIAGYYFLTNSPTTAPVSYFTFPNNYSIVSVLQDATVEFADNSGIIKECKGQPITSDLICHYKKPIKISYQGTINELTFYFKPLGLNAFLDQSLCSYTNDFFANFVPFTDYNNYFLQVLNEKNIETRIDLIENYWLSKLKGFKHLYLHDVIADLQNKKNDYSVAELAKKYGVSRQNLTKHFEKNLCKSPAEFKKIQRFRNTIKNNFTNTINTNGSTISLDVHFYDQSHFIKDFKSLTGLTPKKFFEAISKKEGAEINWLFV